MTAFPLGGSDRVLWLGRDDPSPPAGGRAMLSRINRSLLGELFGERLHRISPRRTVSPRRDAWRGYVDGVDDAFIGDLLATIDMYDIDQMVVDGSNYGAAVAAVKAARPKVRVTTFFHNVEARFFWGALRARPRPKAIAVLAANWVAERAAVRRSDRLVALSQRDSDGLRRLYGRGADAVAPMVLEDIAPARPTMPATDERRYLLFVGGGFYANIAGIRWFVREVAPRIDVPVRIVGRGMQGLAADLGGDDRTVLVGSVDDLAPSYAGAMLVVAPIFDGSGMKTKVAEAMMFGKHVIGTPEAFSGYARDVVAANRCCADADAFVAAIEAAVADPPPAFDPAMRQLYLRDHSPAAARARLAIILQMPDRRGGS